MAYHKLDINGRPIRGRTSREPATRKERGKTLYHYEIIITVFLDDGKRRQYRRRLWLEDDLAAESKERELRHKPPTEALTWVDAYGLWIERNKHKFSAGHIANTRTTMRQWVETFGANRTLEGTGLAEFSDWLDGVAKRRSERASQMRFGHLMALARWCLKRGFVETLPFINAPKPEAKMKKRPPAPVASYRKVLDALPEHLAPVWELLGLTGMRLGAACTLLESDIEGELFTVTTKGGKRVTYPITPGIAKPFWRIVKQARVWKERNGFSKTPTLFCNTAGNRWTSTTVGRYFKKACEDLGIPQVTAHQLRHMVGTSMAKKNMSRAIIQAGLAHDDSSSTDRYVEKDIEMRGIGLDAHAAFLQTFDMKNAEVTRSQPKPGKGKRSPAKYIRCPHCGSKFLPPK